MKLLETKELFEIEGGATSTNSALINAFSNIIKTISSVGRNLGSAIRRIGSNGMCPLS